MGNEESYPQPQQQQPLIQQEQKQSPQTRQQPVANGPVATPKKQPQKPPPNKLPPTKPSTTNPPQTESKSQPPTDEIIDKPKPEIPSNTSTEEKQQSNSAPIKNPYVDANLTKAQQQYSPQQNKQFEQKHEIKKDDTLKPPSSTTKPPSKSSPKILKKPPPKKQSKPKPKPKAKATTTTTTSSYEPEKAPLSVKQKIEEYFHTSYPINITEDVFGTKNDLIRLRRYFHANPELSWQEFETAKNIANYCESLGLAVKKGVGKTGVVAVLHGNYSDGECIGLRADMDALPIQETNDHIAYKSRKPCVSHACGHDCHMAILLTVARILSQPKYVKRLHGCIKFIFQPAEEGGAGAKYMIADGVLEKDETDLQCPAVDQMYGLHVWSYLKLGKIVCKTGALMAGSAKFTIRVKGVGGHGAEPKGTSDTVLAVTQLGIQLHGIISRNLSPIESGVLTIGSMDVGDAANIIAETGCITGTVRYLDNDIFDLIKKRMQNMCEGIEISYGVEINTIWGKNPYDPVINHSDNAQYVKNAVNKVFPINENVIVNNLTTMAAEDFSFYLNERPGCFFFVGCGVDENEGDDDKQQDTVSSLNKTPQRVLSNIEDGDEKKPKIYAHHTPNFRVDERCLIVGVQIMVNLVMDLLTKPKVLNNDDKNDVDEDEEDDDDDDIQLTQIDDFKQNNDETEVIEDKIIGNNNDQ